MAEVRKIRYFGVPSCDEMVNTEVTMLRFIEYGLNGVAVTNMKLLLSCWFLQIIYCSLNFPVLVFTCTIFTFEKEVVFSPS